MVRILVMTGIISFLSSVISPNPGTAEYQVADAYSGLRNMVLTPNPETLGAHPKPNEVWGVLMETGYPEAVATLVALSDGTVSLYFSNGGGIIGLGPRPEPARAARSLLLTAQQFYEQAQPTTSFPLPKQSFTRFYLLTGSGVRTVEGKEDDLGYDRHPFSPLFHGAHELIAEIRRVDEKLRAEQKD